jgi:tryptophan halogenase
LQIDEYDKVCDFITLHLQGKTGDDSSLWKHCGNMNIPHDLIHRIDVFRAAVGQYE